MHYLPSAPNNTIEVKRAQACFPLRANVCRFLVDQKLRIAAVTIAILIPCFWHPRIEAGDLGSHTYNVWLAQLIERGQISGLWIAPMWTNVLFDHLLSGLISAFGFTWGERLAVALCVVTFFWGAFALVCAAAHRVAWQLAPLIAVATYGWTFEMGFFNYYLALGLAFLGVAIFWRGKGWERLLALTLIPWIVLAHPLGAILLSGAGIYAAVAEREGYRNQIGLLAGSAAGIVALHYYLPRYFVVGTQDEYPAYFFNGLDQMMLFNWRYRIVSYAASALVLFSLLVAVMKRKAEPAHWRGFWISLQLYLLVELGVVLLPDGIHVAGQPAALALLTERLTSVSLIFICCVLAGLAAKPWHLPGWSAVAVIFFVFLYQDTGIVYGMERQVERLVGALPADQRVMATILPPPGSRVLIQHILDRACIGHCFAYGDYEPSSQAFRIRVSANNPYVLSDFDLVASMEEGSYTVLEKDVPVYQVYQCNMRGTDLCITPLHAGQENDEMGIHPPER